MNHFATNKIPVKSGRPRNGNLRLKIMKYAYDLAIQQGYQRASLQQIAAAAHVGRPTIYRWWPDKTSLFIDVIKQEFETRRMSIDNNDMDSLHRYLTVTCNICSGPFGGLCIDVLVDVASHPGKHTETYQTYIIDSRERVKLLLKNYADQHDQQFTIPINTITDMVIGIMWYRLIHKNIPFDQSTVSDICQAIDRLLT